MLKRPVSIMFHQRAKLSGDLFGKLEGVKADQRYDPKSRAIPRFPCSLPARIASSDRLIATAGRIVTISKDGAKVEVMFPIKGPPVILLLNHQNDEIYECEVRWRTDAFIGVRFLDILGSGRRQLFFADQPVPTRQLPNAMIRLNEPPHDDGPLGLFDPIWRTAKGESFLLRSHRTPGATKGPPETVQINRGTGWPRHSK
jgi:hypothetical protein